MSETAASDRNSSGDARLSPFAFVSDTSFRFLLLVVSVLGAAAFAYDGLYFRLDHQAPGLAGRLSEPAWIGVGLAFLLALAALIYALYPSVIVARRHLRRLDLAQAPPLGLTLRELQERAGLATLPRLYASPDPAVGGAAFGCAWRRSLQLNAGLLKTAARDPESFSGAVLHELAHVRNRDLDKAFVSRALWWAFLGGALLPWGVGLLDEPRGYVFALVWRTAALAAFVYLVRNAVLRSREHYADVRASSWLGQDSPALSRLLGSADEGRPGWRSLLRVHPDPAERRRVVAEPERLLRIGFWEAFAAGIAAAVVYANFLLVLWLVHPLGDPLERRWLAGLVLAPAVVGVVGVGAWRSAFAAVARNRPTGLGLPLALGLALGFALGLELSYEQAVARAAEASPVGSLDAGWMLAVLVASVLLVGWIMAAASCWLRSGMLTRRAAPSLVLGLAGAAFAAVSGVLLLVREYPQALDLSRALTLDVHREAAAVGWVGPRGLFLRAMDQWTWDTTQRPLLVLLLVALVLLPFAPALLARLRSGRDGVSWAYLGAGRPLRLPPAPLALRGALVVGALGGAAFLVGVLAFRVGLHAGMPLAKRSLDGFAFLFFYWQLVLALAAQLVAAAVASVRAPGLRALHGLLAALLTGTIAALAISVVPSVASCIEPLSVRQAGGCAWFASIGDTTYNLRLVLVEGVVAALAGVCVAEAVVRARLFLRRQHALHPRLGGA